MVECQLEIWEGLNLDEEGFLEVKVLGLLLVFKPHVRSLVAKYFKSFA